MPEQAWLDLYQVRLTAWLVPVQGSESEASMSQKTVLYRPNIEASVDKTHDHVSLCSDFDLDCFKMKPSQHRMCSKSLPMYCGTTDEYVGEFEPKDGHCPFEEELP